MRAVPSGNRAARRIAAAARAAAATGLRQARNCVAERNGASDARCFDLRAGTNGFGRDSLRDRTMESFFMSEQDQAPSLLIPVPRAPAPEIPMAEARREIGITIDG